MDNHFFHADEIRILEKGILQVREDVLRCESLIQMWEQELIDMSKGIKPRRIIQNWTSYDFEEEIKSCQNRIKGVKNAMAMNLNTATKMESLWESAKNDLKFKGIYIVFDIHHMPYKIVYFYFYFTYFFQKQKS